MADRQFPIAETDDYVRKILLRAGKIKKGAKDEEVLAQLLPHVIHQESGGNPRAVSPKGAVGRMQTMPATLRDPGFGVAPAVDDSDEERERVGRDYLLAMIRRYPGRPDLALAAYNAGPARADKWAGIKFRASAGLEGTTSLAPDWGDLPSAVEATEGMGLDRFIENVVGRDSSVAAIARMFEDNGAEFDPNFRLSDIPDDEWKELTRGIPEEQWEGLASAGSRAHLQLLANRIRMANEAEAELAQYGGWGIAGRFALNLLDPLGVAIGVATGGVGTLTQTARLARAAQAARVAGKFDEASGAVRALESLAKSSPWRGAGSAALVAGGSNAALEGVIGYSDPTRDGWDVALAGLTGGILGAGASRIFNGRELSRIQTAYLRERSLLEIAELNHRIDLKKTELSNQLADLAKTRSAIERDPDVAQARADLDALQKELVATATGRRQELAKMAEGALKRSELGSLRRTLEGLRKQARSADTLEAEVEARMLREDIEAMGEEIARGKPRTKLRQRAAKAEARQRVETITANLQRAETAFARATAAEDARVELRRVERVANKERPDHLWMLDEPGRNAFGERELALSKKLQAALDVQAGKLKQLDETRTALEGKLTDLEAARAAGVKASDRAIATEAEAFGGDTASAARFMGFDEGTHPHLDGEDWSGLPSVSKMAMAGAVRHGPMATFSGILRGSDNELVRKLLGPLVGNSVGNKDGSVNVIGASEHHTRIHESMTAKFYSAVTPAYNDWAARNGIGMFEKLTRPARERFMGEVGLHIRGGVTSGDPAVAKAAGQVKTIFADYLKQAKDAGVKGLTEVELNDRYLPRVFDFKRLREIEEDIGSDSLRMLIQKSIQSANEDISDKLAAKLAAGYVKRMKELRVGSDAHLMQGVGWDDVAFLRRFLKESGVESEEVESLVSELSILNLQRAGKQEGSFRNAKMRQQLDENFSLKFRSKKSGFQESVEVRVSDLFENNVEALFGRYSRTVSGHIGLAKIGIKSRRDFDDRIKQIERELADDLEELKRVKETADVAYKIITGQPVQDATALTRLGRAARDYNFATTMNQVGWSQFPDSAGLIGKGYIGYTFREFFGGDAWRLFRRTDGSLDDKFAREMEEWLGVGTDFHNNALFSSFDPGEEGGLKGAFGSVEHGLRAMGRGTQMISGMAWITAFTQRLVARNIVQRLVKEVTKGGAFSPSRLAELGLDPAMGKRIAAQLKAHTEFVNGDFGGKVRIVNWSKWDDVEARDGMLYAVFREARRLVQEEDLGDTTKWMHQNWGKIIAQFRRFALVSYSKQLLHGINHRDAEEAVRLGLSMVMATMAYAARHEVAYHAKAVGGASEEELTEYREKFMRPDRYVAAALANNTYSAMLPALFDTTVGLAVGERFFDTRASGLGSDIITGNPTYTALFKNLPRAVSGVAQAALRGDREFDKEDARAIRRLLPWQNVLGVDAMFEAMTRDLPEKDEDADPDRIDWFLQD